MDKNIFLGQCRAFFEEREVKGEMVFKNGEDFYKISNVDCMRPFFMSLVSDSNHWMFISSNGGLTAGRKDADRALFPYYTDDKITESAGITGSKTILQIHKGKDIVLWEPFSGDYKGLYQLSRNLYKNSFGNKIIFEEVNHDLGLTFTYEWNNSDKYGFIKKSSLINNADSVVRVGILDGIQNILPYGLSTDLQNLRSNLADAYKKSELESEVGIGIYALSAIIVDKAEPSEALKANLVWSLGFESQHYLLSSLQLQSFRKGEPLKTEIDVKAEKGAYFIQADIDLGPGANKNWMIIANVNQSVSQLRAISKSLKEDKDLLSKVNQDIDAGTDHLIELTAAADGLQLSRDKLLNTRHFSNTLFNIMRGGIFDKNYHIEKEDFVKYISAANKKVLKKKEDLLANLPEEFSLTDLRQIAQNDQDLNFKRLCLEYMPLKFSRRHGDPSRPWNKFSINTRSEVDGSKILDYEGNWRDIFQNWEALAHSYPEFIESMIHKFLNATTFDGYNPYRVTKGGFDWEVIEADDPWSFIGYWGDHQIIYLLKFLEFIEDHYPNKLGSYFDKNFFVYANVPYKIKSYEAVLANPKDTIDFDHELDERINQKKSELGADGALLRDRNFFIYKVNLIEKLLVTLLAKISNFIPEGGIWMNTQRPEWNDANNALVGNGVSMVTLYYLKRFMTFFAKFTENIDFEEVEISDELAVFFKEVIRVFEEHSSLLEGRISDVNRKKVLDGLGLAAGQYRMSVYELGFSSEKQTLSKSLIEDFFGLTNRYLDHTIASNKRSDQMYHSYNLMTLVNHKEIKISRLPEMLEGQVAVLSSGYLNSTQALELLDAMKSSALFRHDQYSYLLYPDKQLPRFSEKNNISKQRVNNSELLRKLVEDGNVQIIEKDINGDFHFNGAFNNANSLIHAFAELPPETYESLIEQEKDMVLDIFEEIFDHKSFTGRSGTFFGYEGLGSIYWHMVSKLLIAVQENCNLFIKHGDDRQTVGRLLEHFYEIKEGIGVHKSPKLYGAFPTDPYSHTPATKGAQQPGMTGQVKEDVLSRINELGVVVKKGRIEFNPVLLRNQEFLDTADIFYYRDINQKKKKIALTTDSLAFTYCQVPIIYRVAPKEIIKVFYRSGTVVELQGRKLDEKISKEIFERLDVIEKIEVHLKQTL